MKRSSKPPRDSKGPRATRSLIRLKKPSSRRRGEPGGSGAEAGRRGRGRGPSGPGEGRLALWVALSLFGIGLALYVGLVAGYGNLRGPGEGREVELEWPAEQSPEAAAGRLSAAGLVGAPSLFALYLRATGKAGDLRPGHHLLTDDLSPADIMKRMQKSPNRQHAKIVLHEGWNRFEMARRLATARICGTRAFLDATADRALLAELGIAGDSAEGFLFPATYELAMDSEPREIVARLKAEFDKRFDRLIRADAASGPTLQAAFGWGTREIVTLASIIEKEAAVDEERPMIASVFMNRLRDPSFTPKRLQSDPTSAYGCMAMPELPSCHGFSGRTTPEMNSDDANPYSTYRHEGLPPGPITNPGEKSIAAVLAPAETRYLFFVARGEGRHTFSETFAQHNEAIRKGRNLAGP
jgi:peptidoglycan lytic transglycosylase G